MFGAGLVGLANSRMKATRKAWFARHADQVDAAETLREERAAEARREARAAMPKTRDIGIAGAGLTSAVDKFGTAAVEAGIRGEQLTAQQLDTLLTDLPQAQVIHGLRFPGSAEADVDHAVVYGNKLLLIDSKYWGPGHYYWHGEAVARGHGRSFQLRESGFPIAVTRFEEIVGTAASVRAVIAVHHAPGTKITIDDRQSPSQNLNLYRAGGLAVAVDWLVRDQDQGPETIGRRQATVLAALGPYLPAR